MQRYCEDIGRDILTMIVELRIPDVSVTAVASLALQTRALGQRK